MKAAQKKRLATLKRHRAKHRRDRSAREKMKAAQPTQAIVLAKAAPAAIQLQSVIPEITQVIENMERVRRFVSKALNVDLQRELAKLAKKKLKPDEHNKEEVALRDRFEVDWGTIPGVDKPFLKQPGAEKFMFWLNLRPKFFPREIDKPDGHLEIVCKVIVYSKKTKEEVFEGPDCSCTTMESNYRFRWAERAIKPPQEDADKLKAAGLGKWKKKRVWAHGKPATDEWVWLDRIENPNIHDERNKVRQIGEKRALVKCIRNMGAISEIFTSDPSEWEQEVVEEGSPVDDQDFTPEGRRILTKEGKSPSGRYQTFESEHREQKAAAQKVADARVAEAKAKTATKGLIEVYWGSDGKEVAQLRGDPSALASLLPVIQKECLAVWLDGAKAWTLPIDDVPKVKEICARTGYQFQETQSLGQPTPTGAPSDARETQPEPTTRTEAAPTSQGVPASVVGVIKKAVEDQTSEKKIPILRVSIGGQVLGSFDKKIWPFIMAGQGMEAELLVKGARRDIVGIKRINKRMFESDGHTPIIQNSEDRPTHIGALFT